MPLSFLAENVAMEPMRRYYRWRGDLVAPYLGSRVLEVGCGTGSMMARIDGVEVLVGVDRDRACVERAGARLAERPEVAVRCVDVLGADFLRMAELRCDTVLFANSLEMTGDPGLALRHAREVLAPGGKVVVVASALPAMTGELDRAMGQCRFSREGLVRLLEGSGFGVLAMRYSNLLGILPWWWDSRFRKRRSFDEATYRMRDAAVPLARLVDALTGPPVGRLLVACGGRA